ncbi:MAG: hypothetical protein JXB47_17690 [Anaerolineae bacterium]|nr:hypothetical protein [Anaerolineae bacterium]
MLDDTPDNAPVPAASAEPELEAGAGAETAGAEPLFAPEPRFTSERFIALDDAIAARPDVAVNYLLRGELLLEQGWPALARPDFERAAALIRARVQANDWDSVGRVLLDRAEAGLAKAVKPE